MLPQISRKLRVIISPMTQNEPIEPIILTLRRVPTFGVHPQPNTLLMATIRAESSRKWLRGNLRLRFTEYGYPEPLVLEDSIVIVHQLLQ